MNKFVNVLLLFILFPTMLFTIYVGFDMPISFLNTTGNFIPYKFEIFLGIGLMIFIINLRRSFRRWMGLRIVNKQKKFQWNHKVSKSRRNRVLTYLSLEFIIYLFTSVALYKVSNDAIYPALALFLGAFDIFILSFASSKFRVGLSSKAIIVADRDVHLIYFTGLRKVSIHQQSVHFDYIKGLHLAFPLDCIQEDKRDEFFDILESQLDRDKVFFSKIRT